MNANAPQHGNATNPDNRSRAGQEALENDQDDFDITRPIPIQTPRDESVPDGRGKPELDWTNNGYWEWLPRQ